MHIEALRASIAGVIKGAIVFKTYKLLAVKTNKKKEHQ
jgi:hypothetical protein